MDLHPIYLGSKGMGSGGDTNTPSYCHFGLQKPGRVRPGSYADFSLTV